MISDNKRKPSPATVMFQKIPEDERNNYRLGVRIAKLGFYQDAIRLLTPYALTRSANPINDIGVCYERSKDYLMAAIHYYASDCIIAKINYLKMFKNGYLKPDVEHYKFACNYLIKKKVAEGYVFMSRLYRGLYGGKTKLSRAHEIINQCIRECEQHDLAIFEEAIMLDECPEEEFDIYESHALLEQILDTSHECRAEVHLYYGEQCLAGLGCRKDIDQAIDWFEKAAKAGSIGAMERLIEIYSSDGEYNYYDRAELWRRRLKKAKGE